MIPSIVNPADPPERQHEKLLQIVEVLMRRVEQDTDDSGVAYAQFQRAVLLEDEVRQRTSDLERALDLLNESNALLAEATQEAEAARQNLADAIEAVREGFALFDAENLLVLFNTRFCSDFSDVHGLLVEGMRFEEYVALVSRSRFLALPPDESPESWSIRRLRRHADNHVMFNVRLTGDRWIQVSEHRTRDGGTVVLQTDVTDIIRMERRERGRLLDDQAQMIRATLDHIDQGVSIFDAEGHLVGWNRRLAMLLAVPSTPVQLGAPFDVLLRELMHHMQLSTHVTAARLIDWARAGDGRAPLAFELSQGEDLVLAVFAQEMPDGGFVMSFSDITAERHAMRAIREAKETLEQRVEERTVELAAALERAERANASRSRFVAAASHDLLQPLSAAKLYLASVADGALTSPARSTLGKAQDALASVESILDALLDISKLESSRAAADLQPVDLGMLLDRLAGDFAPMAERKGLALDVGATTAIVRSDPTYLRRILQNLISNAIRYTATGSVRVEAHPRGTSTVVRVIDTGPGIPKSEQKNIFREFHRLNAHASAADGMGLGLTIVERACALLAHPLTLRSAPGEGTSFSLTLPMVTGQQPAPKAATAGEPEAAGGRIILLVENDSALRQALGQLLEKWGYEIIDADSGEAALALLAEIDIAPDMVLADYQLGDGMDGLATLAGLRALHGPLPSCLITANRAPEVVRRCEADGFGLLYKPIDTDDLAHCLREIEPRLQAARLAPGVQNLI
ncbi:MAG: PAS-domain containing protein [Rhodobacteraceae bacterium]|nr:PAS-domain containing protein [Paracoccaceae bacterium]